MGFFAGLFIGLSQTGGEIMKSNSITKALGLDNMGRDAVQFSTEDDWIPKLKPKGQC